MYKYKQKIALRFQTRLIVSTMNGFITSEFKEEKQQNTIFFFDLDNQEKYDILITNEYIDNLYKIDSNIIIETDKNSLKIINTKDFSYIEYFTNVKEEYFFNKFGTGEVGDKYVMVVRNHFKLDGKYQGGYKSIFSLEEKKRLSWQNSEIRNPHIKQGYLFDYDYEYFARYSGETGELLWKIDVSELGHGLTFTHDEYVGSVYDIICVYKGVVYVAFKSSRSAGIDIETGEVVWDMLDIYIGTRTPDIKGFALDTQREGILHGLWAGYYVEIDLNQRTRTQHYIRDMVESKNLEIPNTFIQNGKYLFYSSGALAGNDKNTIAAFNPSTKDIDWQYEFDLADAYTISQPLFGGKYMYVYDNNLRLHVFEKEENE